LAEFSPLRREVDRADPSDARDRRELAFNLIEGGAAMIGGRIARPSCRQAQRQPVLSREAQWLLDHFRLRTTAGAGERAPRAPSPMTGAARRNAPRRDRLHARRGAGRLPQPAGRRRAGVNRDRGREDTRAVERESASVEVARVKRQASSAKGHTGACSAAGGKARLSAMDWSRPRLAEPERLSARFAH
jgi:hypothetical protein